MKTKTKSYRTIKWRKTKKTKRKKKKEKLEHCGTLHIGKRKKERTDIFSKIDSTSVHRLKKKKKRKLNIFEL